MPFRTMLLRGSKVFARCDEHGELVATGGKVEIRYKPGDGKAYFATVANLSPHSDAIVRPDGEFGEAKPVQKAEKTQGGAPAASGAKAGVRAGAKPAGYAPTRAEDGEAIAYADGACSGNPGPAGLGVVMITPTERLELSEYLGVGTNNIAELTAILRAAQALPPSANVLKVFTDSSYSIGVLSKGWKAKANVELVAEVKRALAKLPAWELHHVRGHVGVPLNEAADKLAVKAVESRHSPGWTLVHTKKS